MSKNKFYIFGMPALLLAFGAALILGACVNPASPGTDAPVNPLDLTGQVTTPVTGAAPDTTAINTDQYEGSIVWKTADGLVLSENFAAGAVYKAKVRLTAKGGFTFNGFSHTGATSVTFDAKNGIVTITFKATKNTDFDLTGLVIAPVKGGTPVTTPIDTANVHGNYWLTKNGRLKPYRDF
jgi:hypothetical protein